MIKKDWSNIDLDFVRKNKSLLTAEKKLDKKFADAVTLTIPTIQGEKTSAYKAVNVPLDGGEGEDNEDGVINRKLVINSTNIIDSHMDCHIPGLWKKCLSEIKQFWLLQEHCMEYDKIICDSTLDNLKAYTKNYTFSELGFPEFKGSTECLIFDAEIKEDVNEDMYKRYFKGRVNNHSVGMKYVKLYLCINSDDPMDSAEKDNWDKYYPAVVNKEVADQKGYFWAVTEAKFIEGSAVVAGSNFVTPVLSESQKNTVENNGEPSSTDTSVGNKKNTTSSEPTSVTQGESSLINYFLIESKNEQKIIQGFLS